MWKIVEKYCIGEIWEDGYICVVLVGILVSIIFLKGGLSILVCNVDFGKVGFLNIINVFCF